MAKFATQWHGRQPFWRSRCDGFVIEMIEVVKRSKWWGIQRYREARNVMLVWPIGYWGEGD